MFGCAVRTHLLNYIVYIGGACWKQISDFLREEVGGDGGIRQPEGEVAGEIALDVQVECTFSIFPADSLRFSSSTVSLKFIVSIGCIINVCNL